MKTPIYLFKQILFSKIQSISILILIGLVLTNCTGNKYEGKVATIGDPIEQIDPATVCIKHISEILPSTITKIGDVKVQDAKDINNPPVFQFAVVNLEINNFDPNFPPIITVFNEKTGLLLDSIYFKPLIHPCKKPGKQSIPVYLAFDKTPRANAGQEPESPVSRIVIQNPLINHSETIYAKLHNNTYGGVFVVPIAWHNLAESQYGGKSNVDNQDVVKMFWTAPDIKQYVSGAIVQDLNTIWAQAGIQFRLLNTGIPSVLSDIPTHILNLPDKAEAKGCQIMWKNALSDKKGVDVYTMDNLMDAGGVKVAGIGNCLSDGFVLIEAPTKPGGALNTLVVAHEFGHYLGQMCHVDQGNCGSTYNIKTHEMMNNLMHSMSADWELKDLQIKEIRKRLKSNILRDNGYNEGK